METPIYAAVIGGLSGLLGALIVARQNEKALRAAESRARDEMAQRLRIAQTDLDTRLAIVCAEQKNKFKLAALDKRLEIYQTAYSRWVELRWHLFEQDTGQVAQEFQKWFIDHYLFLDEKTQEFLNKAIFHAPHYRSYDDTMKQTAWDAIESAGNSILNAVNLSFMPEELTKPPEPSNKARTLPVTRSGPPEVES